MTITEKDNYAAGSDQRRNLFKKMGRRLNKEKSRRSFSSRVVIAIIISFLVFGTVTGIIGFCVFRYSVEKEYDAATRNIALTASALVDGDSIGGDPGRREAAGYSSEEALLKEYCRNMDLSRIDVVAADAGDDSRIRSVLRAVNPNGTEQATEAPDQEYVQAYRALYENGSAYEIIRHTDVFGMRFYTTAFVPVRNSSGQVAAVLAVQRSFRPMADAFLYYIVSVLLATVLFSAAASCLASRYARKQFVTPVEQISAEAVRFANENKADQPLGNISRIDELSALAGSIDTVEAKMTDYINELTAATAEKERIRTEMNLAGRIQSSQIPGTFPAFPGRNDFDIYGSMTPARVIGGDFFNYLLIDDDHLAMWVGDVSGKGTPAALFMMSANLMLSARVRFKGSPAEILEDVNNRICENNAAQMFVTVWLGVLELSTGRLAAANGGHLCPVVCRNGCFELLKDKHGMVLGGLDGSRYTDYEIPLAPGDKVFMYSDGVTEARNSRKEMFRMARLAESLNRHGNGSPGEIIRAVKSDIDEFAGDAPQFDDITMLLVEYRGQPR